MTDDLIIVKANIYLLTPEEGGRRTGIKSGYRPNHVFEKPNNIKEINAYIEDFQFGDQDSIQPGQTRTVTVRFLRNPIVEQYIKVGQKWFIYEVPRLVAEGEIIEVSATNMSLCNWGSMLKQLSAFINLASVPGRQLVNSPTASNDKRNGKYIFLLASLELCVSQ